MDVNFKIRFGRGVKIPVDLDLQELLGTLTLRTDEIGRNYFDFPPFHGDGGRPLRIFDGETITAHKFRRLAQALSHFYLRRQQLTQEG